MRRNGVATASSPRPARRAGSTSWSISTNEVFDGDHGRTARPHEPTDPIAPATRTARRRPRASGWRPPRSPPAPGAALGIARTAWLFGTPGRDFPSRILDAAERARAAGEPLARRRRRVGDTDLHCRRRRCDRRAARREDATAGIHHLVNGLFATRADWARYVVAPGRPRRRGRQRPAVDLGAAVARRRAGACWPRRRCRPGEPMRSWPDAMADYAPALSVRGAGGVRA